MKKTSAKIQIDSGRLRRAVQDRNLLAREIIDNPDFLHSVDDRGFGLLHWAVFIDNPKIECVQLLLEKGLRTMSKCNFDRTALHYACRYGHLDVVKLLIEKGSDALDEKDTNSNTPLDLAKREKYKEIADYIEEYKKKKREIKPEEKSVGLLKKVRDSSKDSNYSNQNVILSVEAPATQDRFCKKFTLQEMRELLIEFIAIAKEEPSANAKLNNIYEGLCEQTNLTTFYLGYLERSLLEKFLLYACKFGYLSLVKRLIDKEKVDVNCNVPNAEEPFCLGMAVRYSQPDIIEYLLRKHAKTKFDIEESVIRVKDDRRTIEKKYFSALEHAILHHSKVSILTLLQFGCSFQEIKDAMRKEKFQKEEYKEYILILDENLKKRQAFLEACRKDNLKEMEDLLSKGIFIDCDDSQKRNGLYLAVREGKVKTVEFFIKKKASFSEHSDRTCLMVAIDNFQRGDDYFNMLALLLEEELQVELTKRDRDPKIILAKMITTLLYKNKRYGWNAKECAKLRKNIQYFAQRLFRDNDSNPKDRLSSYKKWLESKDDFYGSYLSSDSDSEEEKLYRALAEDKQRSRKRAVAERIIELEESAYLPDYKGSSKNIDKKIEKAMQRKMAESEEILKQKPITDFHKVFQDGRNHFQKDGQIFLQGTWPKSEIPEENKVYPIYNSSKVNGASSLLHRSRIPIIVGKKTPQYYIASYRGYTYVTSLWNKEARRAHRKKNELNEPLYSMATLFDVSGTSNFRDLSVYESSLSKEEHREFSEGKNKYACALKSKIRDLANTGGISRLDVKDIGFPSGGMINGVSYDDLSQLLQIVYTTNYDFYFRLLDTDFFKNRLMTNHSPFVSTAETPYHALKYAYGIKTFPGHQDETLRPCWRADGKAERPYSGKVYIILHTQDDLKDAHRIMSMLWEGRCIVPQEIAAERELSHFAFVDKNKIVYQHIAKYPSFDSKYKAIYQYKYGMSPDLYKDFRQFFFECQRQGDLFSFQNLLAEYLCAYHEMRFVKIAAQIAENQGGILVYLDEYGKIKNNGLSATYSTPYAHLSSGSLQQKDKENVKESFEWRKKDKSFNLLVDQSIFESAEKRQKRFFSLVLNLLQSDSLVGPRLQSKSERALLDEINAIEIDYTTLLHYALIENEIEIAKRVIDLIPSIERKRDIKRPFWNEYINLKDRFGNTPLHLAALNEDKKLYSLLLEKGADLHALNRAGLSPDEIMNMKPGVKEKSVQVPLCDEEQIEISSGEKSISKFSRSSSQTIQALGDGNCLFNAVALGIARLIQKGPHESSQRCKAILNQDIDMNLDDDSLQEQMAPVLRSIAIHFLRTNYEHLKDRLKPRLEDLYARYRSDKEFRDDDFVLEHEFVRAKLDEADLSMESFLSWWDEQGKEQYFAVMEKPALCAEQRDKWGGEFELWALAFSFGINICWNNREAVNLAGVLGGLVLSAEFTENEIHQLITLGLAQRILVQSEGNPVEYLQFSPDISSKINQLTPLMEDYQRVVDYLSDYMEQNVLPHERISTLKADMQDLSAEQLNFIIDRLVERDVIVKDSNGSIRLIMDDGVIIAKERIRIRMAGINEALIQKLRAQMSAIGSILSFEVEFTGAHWNYKAATTASSDKVEVSSNRYSHFLSSSSSAATLVQPPQSNQPAINTPGLTPA